MSRQRANSTNAGVFDESPPDTPRQANGTSPTSTAPPTNNNNSTNSRKEEEAVGVAIVTNGSFPKSGFRFTVEAASSIQKPNNDSGEDTDDLEEVIDASSDPLSQTMKDDLVRALPPGAMTALAVGPPKRRRSFAVCEPEEGATASESAGSSLPEATQLPRGVSSAEAATMRQQQTSQMTKPPGSPVLPTATSTGYLMNWASERRFGFPPRSQPHLLEAEIKNHTLSEQQLAVAEKEWSTALQKGAPLLTHADEATSEPLRRLARKYSVPPLFRGIMWLTLSSVAHTVEQNESFCEKLLDRFGNPTGDSAEIIEKDLDRTFPEHPHFMPGSVGRHRLRRVLYALVWRNPLLGYCQSFNFLAALLLLFLDDEESVFWMMCHVLERLLPNDYYSATLAGVKVDQCVTPDLVKQHLPKLHTHFTRIGFEPGVLVPAWLMSIFIGVLPIEATVVVWDYFLCGAAAGGEKSVVPLSILLALLKVHQEELLQVDDAGELAVYVTRAAHTTFDGLRLVKLAHEFKLAPSAVQALRCKHRTQIAKEEAQKLATKRRIQQAAQFTENAIGMQQQQRSDSSTAIGSPQSTPTTVGNASLMSVPSSALQQGSRSPMMSPQQPPKGVASATAHSTSSGSVSPRLHQQQATTTNNTTLLDQTQIGSPEGMGARRPPLDGVEELAQVPMSRGSHLHPFANGTNQQQQQQATGGSGSNATLPHPSAAAAGYPGSTQEFVEMEEILIVGWTPAAAAAASNNNYISPFASSGAAAEAKSAKPSSSSGVANGHNANNTAARDDDDDGR